MAIADSFAAVTGARPVSLQRRATQALEIAEDDGQVIRCQKLTVVLLEAGCTMTALPKWPLSGAPEDALPKEEVSDWAI